MSEFRTEDSEKHTERKVIYMSAAAEASSLLRFIAEPRPVGDTVKAAITRAARRVGLRPGRCEDLWRCEARTVLADEMDAIRRVAIKQAQEEQARAELRSLSDLISKVEAQQHASRMGARDADFHSAQDHALVQSLGPSHRPLDRGER